MLIQPMIDAKHVRQTRLIVLVTQLILKEHLSGVGEFLTLSDRKRGFLFVVVRRGLCVSTVEIETIVHLVVSTDLRVRAITETGRDIDRRPIRHQIVRAQYKAVATVAANHLAAQCQPVVDVRTDTGTVLIVVFVSVSAFDDGLRLTVERGFLAPQIADPRAGQRRILVIGTAGRVFRALNLNPGTPAIIDRAIQLNTVGDIRT